MIRVADGQDPYIIDKSGQTDACGLTFDDVQRTVVHPHVIIPTQEEKQAMLRQLEEIVVEKYPELARRG